MDFFSRKIVEIHPSLCICPSVSARANDVNNTESQWNFVRICCCKPVKPGHYWQWITVLYFGRSRPYLVKWHNSGKIKWFFYTSPPNNPLPTPHHPPKNLSLLWSCVSVHTDKSIGQKFVDRRQSHTSNGPCCVLRSDHIKKRTQECIDVDFTQICKQLHKH